MSTPRQGDEAVFEVSADGITYTELDLIRENFTKPDGSSAVTVTTMRDSRTGRNRTRAGLKTTEFQTVVAYDEADAAVAVIDGTMEDIDAVGVCYIRIKTHEAAATWNLADYKCEVTAAHGIPSGTNGKDEQTRTYTWRWQEDHDSSGS